MRTEVGARPAPRPPRRSRRRGCRLPAGGTVDHPHRRGPGERQRRPGRRDGSPRRGRPQAPRCRRCTSTAHHPPQSRGGDECGYRCTVCRARGVSATRSAWPIRVASRLRATCLRGLRRKAESGQVHPRQPTRTTARLVPAPRVGCRVFACGGVAAIDPLHPTTVRCHLCPPSDGRIVTVWERRWWAAMDHLIDRHVDRWTSDPVVAEHSFTYTAGGPLKPLRRPGGERDRTPTR